MRELGNLAAALASIQKDSVGSAYSVYAPGTKLLNTLGFEETQKQNEISNAMKREESQENVRQFNEKLAEEKRKNDMSYSASMASAAASAARAASSGASSGLFSTTTERANDTQTTLMKMLSNQYRMSKDDPVNPSKTPLKDTMDWYSYTAREIAPNISEEDRQKVAYDYMALVAASSGTSIGSAQMQKFVEKYTPSVDAKLKGKNTGSTKIDLTNPNSFDD